MRTYEQFLNLMVTFGLVISLIFIATLLHPFVGLLLVITGVANRLSEAQKFREKSNGNLFSYLAIFFITWIAPMLGFVIAAFVVIVTILMYISKDSIGMRSAYAEYAINEYKHRIKEIMENLKETVQEDLPPKS